MEYRTGRDGASSPSPASQEIGTRFLSHSYYDKKKELKLEELVTHAKLCLAFPYVIFLVVLAISTRFI